MPQRFLTVTLSALAALAFSVLLPATAMAASDSDTPAPFALQGAPRDLGGGVQQAWRVKVDEDSAVRAIFKGGMWLPNGAGGREYARYSSHILHPDGSWTWIGKVATAHGEQSAVITFGKDAVFGRIPQGNDYPLRLETERGAISLVRTSGAAVSRSAAAVAMRAKTDARLVPRLQGAQAGKAAPAAAEMQSQGAATNDNVIIDVMVAYTPGIVSEYGSASAALTRIDNLVAITNQAYSDSQVNQRIRLVNTVQVDYPDDTSNDSALDDVTGLDSNGNPVKIPASLSQIHSLRSQYGADLVSLLRRYDNATNGGCGLAWIIGGNLTPIVPGQSYLYGYSVVGDGADAGKYCLDTSFAHELGHNMGDAHDRANADQPGAYSYSYGYKSSSSSGFSTVMAYGDPGQTPLAVFSNPNISICENQPCGVADNASNSADNAHSMNNTASLIAQFENKRTSARYIRDDVNADGKSDIFWYSQNLDELTYWLMNGPAMVAWKGFDVGDGYHPVGFGDFNGDGRADVLWDDGHNNIYMWLSNTSGGFSSQFLVTHQPSSSIVGTGDINHDGFSDIFWLSPSSHQATYWLMSGNTMLSWRGFAVPDDYRPAGTGDFNGDGLADILWSDSARHVYMWLVNSSGAFASTLINTYQSGWGVAGVGDVNADGKSDIFWFNQGIGKITYWLMDGSKMTSWSGFTLPNVNTPIGFGDYDGNGKADVLWNQPANRSLWMWVNDGKGGFTRGHLIVNYSSNFVPLN